MVERYLEDAGLMPYLEALGFHLAGFGCTTCIGNSGPLHPEIEKAIAENDLTVAAVLSGNRNFEARIHQRIKANFLASPMLVVAFALAGRIDVDLYAEPVGLDPNGEPVYLEDIWPEPEEIAALVADHVKPAFFEAEYGRIFDGDEFWRRARRRRKAPPTRGTKRSTYIKKPPYFDGFSRESAPPADHCGRPVPAGAGGHRHHRPHLAGRRHPRDLPGRPIPASAKGWTRPTSTPTVPAAATTR